MKHRTIWIILVLASLAVAAATRQYPAATLGLIAARPASASSPGQTDENPLVAFAPLADGSRAGGDFLISVADLEQYAANVAFNPTADEYLVVWSDSRRGAYPDIYGQFFSAQGVPIGENFPISLNFYAQRIPRVAFDESTGEYLVIWSDGRVPSTLVVYGQRLDANGVLLDNPGTPANESDPVVNFLISESDYSTFGPAVASNQNGEFLVVWSDGRTHVTYDIYGQRVGPGGSLIAPGNFPISTAGGHQLHPLSIAYNLAATEYLVVWSDRRSGVEGEEDIFGQRVDTNGALLDNPDLPGDQTDPAVNFPISNPADQQWTPAVAANGSSEYLVVWIDERNGATTGADIYGQRVDTDGNLLDNPLTPANETDPKNNFVVNAAEDEQTVTGVAYNPDNDQYLVVWHDHRQYTANSYDIYGQRIAANGFLALQGEFAIHAGAEYEIAPSVAYGAGSGQYLVVWQGSQDAQAEIRGQRVWWPGLPVGSLLTISAATLSQTTPAVAYNPDNGDYLVVWADERAGNADIYGQLYHSDGAPFGSNFVVHAEAGDQLNPAVASTPIDGSYFVVWQDDASGDIEAQKVSGAGYSLGSVINIYHEHPAYRPILAHDNLHLYPEYLVVFEAEDVNGDLDLLSRKVQDTGGLSPVVRVIDDSDNDPYNAAIAYSVTSQKFLVVFAYFGENIYGALFDPHGAISGPLNEPFHLSDGINTQDTHPALAWNSTADEFLTVWQGLSGGDDYDVLGIRVQPDGDKVGSTFQISTSTTDDDQMYPDVVYIPPPLDRYRVVWQDNREFAQLGWDLRGQWVAADGTVLGLFDGPAFRYPGWQEYPAIAFNPDESQALTVWQDGRNGVEYDIYGRLGALDLTPPTARFTVDPGTFVQFGTEFAFNAWWSRDNATPRGLLMVRWDFESDGFWDTSLSLDKTATYSFPTPGVYTVTLEVSDLAWLTSTTTHIVHVLSGRAAMADPPTAALAVTDAFGQAGDLFAFDSSASIGAGTRLARWDWENDGEWDTDFGTVLTATHTYTAAGDYTARVEIKDDTGLSDAAIHNLTVVPGSPDSLAVIPNEVILTPGESLNFEANAWDVYTNPMYHPDVTWSVTNAQAGTIDASGVFTASMQAGTYPGAILASSNGITNTATVTTFWPFQVYLPIIVR